MPMVIEGDFICSWWFISFSTRLTANKTLSVLASVLIYSLFVLILWILCPDKFIVLFLTVFDFLEGIDLSIFAVRPITVLFYYGIIGEFEIFGVIYDWEWMLFWTDSNEIFWICGWEKFGYFFRKRLTQYRQSRQLHINEIVWWESVQ